MLTSSKLSKTLAPCFVNGDADLVAVGGWNLEGVEIWNVKSKTPIHHIECTEKYINCMFSAYGILAVGFDSGVLQLHGTRDWEILRSQEYSMNLRSIHLSADARYLVIGGEYGESPEVCVVLQVQ